MINVILAIGIIAFIYIKSSIKVVPQNKVYIIERLGKYKDTASTGIVCIMPLIDKIKCEINMGEQVFKLSNQEVVASNNIHAIYDAFVYYEVVEPQDAAYKTKNYAEETMKYVIEAIKETANSIELYNEIEVQTELEKQLYKLDDESYVWGCKINKIQIMSLKKKNI